MLKNFRKCDSLRLNFQPATNVLIGDNECDKSSVLLALDLVLSGSWERMETFSAEFLISRQAFRAGQCRADLRQELIADVFSVTHKNLSQLAVCVRFFSEPRYQDCVTP